MAQRTCRSTLLVTVLDQSTNQPVDGLTAKDFHLKFKGHEISVRAVSQAPLERQIVVVLDRSGSMAQTSNEPPNGRYDPNSLEKLTLGDALKAIPNGYTVAFIAFAGQYSHQTEFMDPATALGKMTEIVKWEPEGNGQKKRTALWDNLDAASRMLIPNKPGDLIVVVSDGGDNMSTVHEEKVQKELLSADVSLIAMIVASPFSAIPEEGDSLGALLELVKATGGTVRVAGLTVLGKDPEVIVPVRPGELIAQLAHQYELEVDEPLIEKPEKWQLSVGPLESGRTVQPFYRRYLLPCRATP